MEHKSFAVSEVKALKEPGQFEALVSVFDNVDDVGDRVRPGAFKRAIKELPPPPVVFSHIWGIPPVGETLDWGEVAKGLMIKGGLFVDEGDKHSYADMCYAAMKSRDGRPPALREFSFAYDVPEGGSERVTVDGKSVRDLIEIFPVFEVGPTLVGANRETGFTEPPKAVLPVASVTPLLQRTVASKAYDDIESYAVYLLLQMIDYGTSYVAWAQDSDEVSAMKGILGQLLEMLADKFAESGVDAEAKARLLVERLVGGLPPDDIPAPTKSASPPSPDEVRELLFAPMPSPISR